MIDALSLTGVPAELTSVIASPDSDQRQAIAATSTIAPLNQLMLFSPQVLVFKKINNVKIAIMDMGIR
jgi:hypothetical protein